MTIHHYLQSDTFSLAGMLRLIPALAISLMRTGTIGKSEWAIRVSDHAFDFKHSDMTDRISMRDHLISVAWPEAPGEQPDWRCWRSTLENNKSSADSLSVNPNDSQDLCRSIRAFVGWKPKS
jgi:hypothetical protein